MFELFIFERGFVMFDGDHGWFELFYSDGGHGGPYRSVQDAVDAAVRLANGVPDHVLPYRVDVRPYGSACVGGYGAPVVVVRRHPERYSECDHCVDDGRARVSVPGVQVGR